MNIPLEDLRRLIFHEKKTYEEIAKMYSITTNKLKKYVKTLPLPINQVKPCQACKETKRENPPPEGSGGMSFELTKD